MKTEIETKPQHTPPPEMLWNILEGAGLSHAESAPIVRAVNCHEEIIERLKSMSGAYHMHHAGKPTDSQYWFDNCGDGVCTENRLAIAKAEGK